ncbi:bacterio-opsin activator domain-containing protein [Natronosalvus vescus]|uniref:helix-turn-helix domain-containing protein n=1 Tax=Natronosalvus vescus TaxID=2953881 RepID=UPI0020905D4E|nr:bacterio-opsin activator domain-containing protein [Natronosalvus vescus]
MSFIAEIAVTSDDFALDHVLAAAPEMVVEVERVVATMEDRIMPYFWVTGGDFEAFEEAFEADGSVNHATVIDEVDDSKLYRAEWTKNVESIVTAYLEIGATLLKAVGKDGRWELRMRFDDHENLAAFRAYCSEHDIRFELLHLQEQNQPMASAQFELSSTQRNTLLAALEAGYYEVPQRATMTELAAMLGISQQALSKRLHVAHKNLITSTIAITRSDDG